MGNVAWRISRALYTRARGDVPNDPRSNGEYALIARIGDLYHDQLSPVFLDVGANVGDWSAEVLRRLANAAPVIHAFEPSSETFACLRKRLTGSANVTVHQ